MSIKKICIMQPYFVPYPGYFRLMEAADIFVIFDCVQFPRRGYVHRNQVLNSQNNKQWLTLSLEKGERSTKIKNLVFRRNVYDCFNLQLKKLPLYQALKEKRSLVPSYSTLIYTQFIISLNS